MNRLNAVQYLHERHPSVVDAPDDEIDRGTFQLELFWLQSHTLEAVDRRSERTAKRCFATIHHVLERGNPEVRDAVYHHFLYPHLVHHPDLEWAVQRMPAFLAKACGALRTILEEERERDHADERRP